MDKKFVTVIFPLALPKLYSYSVPDDLSDRIMPGIRVEVALKNKLYAAIVAEVHGPRELEYKPKPVLSIIDSYPVITPQQLKFWAWMADYYCSTYGEVMHIAMPAGMKLSSETRFVLDSNFQDVEIDLSDDEYMIVEALTIQNELPLEKIQGILNKKTVYPVIRSLLDKRIIYVKEEMIRKFKPKLVNHVRLGVEYEQNRNNLYDILPLLERSEKQTKTLLAYIQIAAKGRTEIAVNEITQLAETDTACVQALVRKGIFELYQKEISRLNRAGAKEADVMPALSDAQQNALKETQRYLQEKKPVLIHGITGSGKTLIYKELISGMLEKGKQVLYLLPEIALTTQTTERLKMVFGEDVLVYHSRLSDNERVEIWNAVLNGHKIILGARSGLLLPYIDLGLIIVDEEHDPSYKQNDPSPRYNARDAAVYLARQSDADVILGSATPSLESYYNAISGKFGLVQLTERYGPSVLPDIHIVDLRKELRDKRFDGLLSWDLKEAIRKALDEKNQVIIFQNRRGYAPTLSCKLCGWKAECINCDVNLTVHRYIHELRCHYCGTRSKYPDKCPGCGSDELEESGFGTEKIEEALATAFPDARTGRLDLDSAKTKLAFEKILYEFGEKKTDILVGTQMVTKGLDFDHIAVVGVLNADTLMRYPDLRAHERAFQLLNQVAGRAGRRHHKGQVYIQTYNPDHPIIEETISTHYARFFQRESAERKKFRYPPYFRMIQIELLHKQAPVVEHTAKVFADMIRKVVGDRLLGPAPPSIARLRGQYIQQITIKMEKDPKAAYRIKQLILDSKATLKQINACKNVRINIDVDPY